MSILHSKFLSVTKKLITFYMHDTEETMYDISGAGKPKEIGVM